MTHAKRSETPVSFDVYDGEQLVHRAVFAQTQVTIGKGAKVDLCLEDATLSRIHAVVEIDGPVGGQVIDLASALGTYLNQQKVVRARLRSGDEVTVGRFRIVVAFGEDVGEVGDVLATAPARAMPPAPEPAASPPPEALDPQPDPEPVRVTGLCIVRPGTALVVRSRRTGELRAVRTRGHVLAWPGLHTAIELDLTSFTVLAAASGVGAALSADGLRVDVTLRLTLRPRCDDAVVREQVMAFGVPPRPSLVATCLVEVLSPALAAALAQVPHAALRASFALPLPATSAHGYDLERVDVLHVGGAVPDPAGGYRGGAHDLEAVRFEGSPVLRSPEPLQPVTKPRRKIAPSAITWAEADTSQRVVIGWFILIAGLPVAALMAAARQTGIEWVSTTLFLLALFGLINALIHLRSVWTIPPAVLAVASCVGAANILAGEVAPLSGGGDHTSFSSVATNALVACGFWFAAVLMFARNPKADHRRP
ncbi:MAG: FHA domain-containing protein [Sandaracinaceae bacterium]|nr:FHA domain-containing protein [Sandaracinaceae bacterium]